MRFVSYTDFRTTVLKLIDGDDVGTTSFGQDTLDILIGLGENRVYRDLRASTMLAPLSVAVTNSTAALPADLIELKEVYFDSRRPLQVVPLERLREQGWGIGGRPAEVAQDGDTLIFWPGAPGTLLGKYYRRPTDLKLETVWANQTTIARYPELFLFGCVAEAAPFIGEDDRMPMWEAKYRQALVQAESDERWRVYGGSSLRMRAS